MRPKLWFLAFCLCLGIKSCSEESQKPNLFFQSQTNENNVALRLLNNVYSQIQQYYAPLALKERQFQFDSKKVYQQKVVEALKLSPAQSESSAIEFVRGFLSTYQDLHVGLMQKSMLSPGRQTFYVPVRFVGLVNERGETVYILEKYDPNLWDGQSLVGAVLEKVDGQPVSKFEERVAQFYPSNKPEILVDLVDLFLTYRREEMVSLKPQSPFVRFDLTLIDANGETKKVQIRPFWENLNAEIAYSSRFSTYPQSRKQDQPLQNLSFRSYREHPVFEKLHSFEQERDVFLKKYEARRAPSEYDFGALFFGTEGRTVPGMDWYKDTFSSNQPFFATAANKEKFAIEPILTVTVQEGEKEEVYLLQDPNDLDGSIYFYSMRVPSQEYPHLSSNILIVRLVNYRDIHLPEKLGFLLQHESDRYDALVVVQCDNSGGYLFSAWQTANLLLGEKHKKESMHLLLNPDQRWLMNLSYSGSNKQISNIYSSLNQKIEEIRGQKRDPKKLLGPFNIGRLEKDTLDSAIPFSVPSSWYWKPTKPVLVISSEFTVSAGELLTMLVNQGSASTKHIVTIGGTSTAGAGGNIEPFPLDDGYILYMTRSLMLQNDVSEDEKFVSLDEMLQAGPYESVGVPNQILTKEFFQPDAYRNDFQNVPTTLARLIEERQEILKLEQTHNSNRGQK
jgi:hypothetical protein